MSDVSFRDQLKIYKQAIDTDVAIYAAHARKAAAEHYGPDAGEVTSAFLDLLESDGKRIRGALVMAGYEMLGGSDQTMIVRAATALEMVHAYMLVIDDIQDRSQLRRGKPTVHMALTNSRLAGGDPHVGMSLALNTALSGNHAAQMLLAGLSTDPEDIRKVLGIVNHTMVVTNHGQTYDLLYERPDSDPNEADLERVLHWKTAEYTFLNPLCVGMVLTGAGCEDTNAIRDYALHAGKAFQIADDIKGVFGDEQTNGKDTREDIREGKRTFLTVYALAHAEGEDRLFLEAMLGNATLTKAEFIRCRTIIKDCGALQYTEKIQSKHIIQAITALEAAGRPWDSRHVAFLKSLAQSLT